MGAFTCKVLINIIMRRFQRYRTVPYATQSPVTPGITTKLSKCHDIIRSIPKVCYLFHFINEGAFSGSLRVRQLKSSERNQKAKQNSLNSYITDLYILVSQCVMLSSNNAAFGYLRQAILSQFETRRHVTHNLARRGSK